MGKLGERLTVWIFGRVPGSFSQGHAASPSFEQLCVCATANLGIDRGPMTLYFNDSR